MRRSVSTLLTLTVVVLGTFFISGCECNQQLEVCQQEKLTIATERDSLLESIAKYEKIIAANEREIADFKRKQEGFNEIITEIIFKLDENKQAYDKLLAKYNELKKKSE